MADTRQSLRKDGNRSGRNMTIGWRCDDLPGFSDLLKAWSTDGTTAGTNQLGIIATATQDGAFEFEATISYVQATNRALVQRDDGLTGTNLFASDLRGITEPIGCDFRGEVYRSVASPADRGGCMSSGQAPQLDAVDPWVGQPFSATLRRLGSEG